MTKINISITCGICNLPLRADGTRVEPTQDGTINTAYFTVPCEAPGIGANDVWFNADITRNGRTVSHTYLHVQPLTLCLATVNGQFVYAIRQDDIFKQTHYTAPFDTSSLVVALSNDPTAPNTLSFTLATVQHRERAIPTPSTSR